MVARVREHGARCYTYESTCNIISRGAWLIKAMGGGECEVCKETYMCRVRRARQCVLSRVPRGTRTTRRRGGETPCDTRGVRGVRRERAEGTQFLNTVVGKVRKKVSNQVLWTVHTGLPYLYYTYIRLLYIYNRDGSPPTDRTHSSRCQQPTFSAA